VTAQQRGEGWANPRRAARAVVGGWARVSGGAAYVADIRAADAPHVAFVHAQVPHARLEYAELPPVLGLRGHGTRRRPLCVPALGCPPCGR
jgi:CO/xanthine dehydrogenase Mo-binding subunit